MNNLSTLGSARLLKYTRIWKSIENENSNIVSSPIKQPDVSYCGPLNMLKLFIPPNK